MERAIVEAAVRVYRLHRAIHDPRSGQGAERFGGRWNHPGVAIVYTAEARSLAVLECVVHMSELPDDYMITVITLPAGIALQMLPPSDLPAGWDAAVTTAATRDLGVKWAIECGEAILRVPSVVIAEEHNYLLNPSHPEFQKIEFSMPVPFRFDSRLRPPARRS